MATASRRAFTSAEVAQNLARSQASRGGPGSPKVLPLSRAGRQTGDRFETVNAFVDVGMRGVGGAAAKVWMVIWRDTRHGTASVSNRELSLRAGQDERTVRRAVRRLVRSGWLEVVKRGGIGRGASVYRVRVGREVEK